MRERKKEALSQILLEAKFSYMIHRKEELDKRDFANP
jgi:hypothetical protein